MFDNGLNSWTVTGNAWVVASATDIGAYSDTANGTIAQSNLIGWAKGLSASGAARVDINLKWNNGNPEFSQQFNFDVEVNGLAYARMSSSAGAGTTATFTYANGASGNLTSLTASGTMSSWQIELPANVPNTATLVLRYTYVPASSVATDDVYLADVIVRTCTDFGDAPDAASGTAIANYQTTDSDGGPYHLIKSGLSLGSAIDSDAGALQNTAADADDINGTPDDEDGISVFPSLTTLSGQNYSVSVNVTNTTASNAYLVGYIDFNKDGDFLDTGEKSTTLTVTATGNQSVAFTTPSGMTTGATYARFRLSNTQAEAETSIGAATSGEVEDYALTIAAAPAVVVGYKSVKLTTDADSSGSITAGDTLAYTLSYVNTGGASVTNFQINDVLPTDVTITAAGGQTVSVAGTGTTATKNTSYTGAVVGTVSDVLAASATLAPQGVITVTIPVTINLGYFGTLSNRGSASGTSLAAAVQSVNVGQTSDLPASVTAAPYNLTVPATSVSQTSAGTGATLATVSVNTAGAAFACDGYFYQSRNVSGSTRLFRIDRLSAPYTETQLLNFTPYDLNALGLNKQDGYFYALVSPTSASGGLMRIGQSGAQALGPVSGLPAASYVNGTFDNAGNYYVLRITGTPSLYKINLATLTATAIAVSSAVSSGDMAVNPTETGVVMYGLNKSNLFRMVVSGTSASVTSMVVTGISGTVGTVFFDAGGTLYAYSDDGNFYQVNLTTGIATVVTTAPSSSSSDGASCAYTAPKIDVVKSAAAPTVINATTFDVSYTVKVVNRDAVSAPFVQVVDNLAQAFPTAQSVTIQAGPTVTSGSCTANNSGANKFDGLSKFNLLTGTDTLASGASCNITFTARVTYANISSIPTGAQNNSAYASSITSTGTPNLGHGFSGTTLIQPPNVLSTDTSTNTTSLPIAPGADIASPTPVLFSADSITGTVFEDINYGGGAGRSLAASSGVGLPNVRVEAFDANGAYVGFALTDATGKYTFPGVFGGSIYYIRVVTSTVPSSRPGYLASAGLLPVQTYRTNALSGTAVPVTDHVGGEDPTKTDTTNGTTSTTLNTVLFTFSTSRYVQSIAPIKAVTGSLSGVDFGYNFDTIVNTNDSGQGSLRQFILNTNTLGNTGISQVGQPSGKDVSIFMIPDGNAHPGMRAGTVNQLTNGVAIIAASTALPPITDSNTTIDGTTQTTLVGDTNATVLGVGGSVGVDGVSLSTVNGPEIQLIPDITNSLLYGLDLQGNSDSVRGLAISGFGKNLATNSTVFSGNIHITGSNAHIEQNVLGTTAKSFTALATKWSYGSGIVAENASSGTISNNLVGFHDGTGIVLRNSSGFTVSNNEVRGNDLHDFGTMDGISMLGTGSGHNINGNLIIDNGACGIDNSRQDDLLINNNTIKGNGVSRGPSDYSLVETPGIRVGGARARVTRNIIEANYGAGILVRRASAGNGNITPTQNTFSQNAIFQNGNISNRAGRVASGQIGIDLEEASQSTNQGTALFISPNNGLNLGLPNSGMDYPVLTEATLNGQMLTVKGYIGDTGAAADFGGSTIEFFIGDKTDTAQSNGQIISSRTDILGKHWEGKTYLGNCLAYADGNFNCVFNSPLVANLLDVANLTMTATKADGSTSEFGDRIPSVAQTSVSGKVFLDTGTGGASTLANNGIYDASEVGIANSEARLYRCTDHTLLGKALTVGTGAYLIPIPIGIAAGTQLCLEQHNATGKITYLSTGASQDNTPLSSTASAAGITYVRSTDSISFIYNAGAAYNALNFGDVPVNQLITDGVKQASPGNTVVYTHHFIAATRGTVKFSLPGATANPMTPVWHEVLYTDSNCNGNLDSGETQTLVTPINVLEGEEVCLIVKEYVPATASLGASNLVTVKADFVYTNAAPALTLSYTRQDLTTVSDGDLELKKRVRNVTLDGTGLPNWQVNNKAKSGEILEYQITYTNQGKSNITTLTISDTTPAYTAFVAAFADISAANLTGCQKTTPSSATPILCSASDSPVGSGGIQWKFSGALTPGATGNVTFRVRVN